MSAEKRLKQIRKIVKQFPKEIIKTVMLTIENVIEKFRCSTAVALMEKIEQRSAANTSYDVKQEKNLFDFGWNLNLGCLVKHYIRIPEEVHL